MSIVHIAFYPSDWLAGTRGLSDAETGVYITLISKMYEMAGVIERDDERLYRLCGSKTKASFRKSLEYLISEGKILNENGTIFNERVQKEIKIVTEKSNKARIAADSRWNRKPNKNNETWKANASLEHMPQRCQSEPEPEPEKKEATASQKKPLIPILRFQEFWDQFPHRNGRKEKRQNAEAKYNRAVTSGVSEQTLIGAVMAYATTDDVMRGYGRGPIPWLNQKGWTDEQNQNHRNSKFNSTRNGRGMAGSTTPTKIADFAARYVAGKQEGR